MRHPVNSQKLCQWAKTRGELRDLEGNLWQLVELMRTEFEMRRFMRARQVPSAAKLQAVYEKPHFKKAESFDFVFETLDRVGKWDAARTILEEVWAFLAAHENVQVVTIQSPVVLDANAGSDIADQLARSLHKDVWLHVRPNPALVAGVIIAVAGGKTYDYSLKGAFAHLKYFLMEKR
jgi:F0F1-type ATP synthase delta subunit